MAVRNAVLLALLFAVLWEALPAERVHFRIYTTDLLDQHTHTRTVFLKPERRGAWNDRGGPQTAFSFGQYPQKSDAAPPPLTVSTSTMYYPPVLLKTTKYVPHPSQMHKPRPVRLVHPHQIPPPLSSIVFSPPASSLDPQRYAPLRGPSQINNPGCGAFVEGSEHIDKGNCFVEQYENGYRDEESKKTFYGDGNTNVNTEKHGERNSQNFRNEAVYHHDSKHHGKNYRNEAAYHNDDKHRTPASKDHTHHGERAKVKKYRTKNHYSDKKRHPASSNHNHGDLPNTHSYRNEAAHHYPDKKRIPIPENSENSLATQTTTVPPRNDDDEMDEEVPAKAVYFKPLKNGKMKFIVRPSDIKYVKVHDATNLKPGEDVKLVEITKSRKVLPGTGTKIDTVKIVENTEPLPEEDVQSGEAEGKGSRKVRHKSHKSEGPVKYKNVKVREKITRLIAPKKSIKSESKVNPLWVQEASNPAADSGEDDDDDNENYNDNDNLSLEGDSLDDDDTYRVHEELAEASDVPSLMLTPPAEESDLRVRSRGRKPRHSVKYAFAAPKASFEDSWVAAQTEIAKKINEYWQSNVGDTQTSATGILFGGTGSPKSSPSLLGSPDSKSASYPGFGTTDTKGRPSLFDRPDAIDAGLAPRSFGAPFEFAISDSSEKNGKPLNDLFTPSSMQQEFFPADPKHPVASGQGKSEQAVTGGGFEHSAEDVFEEMLPLAKLIVTKEHVFKATTSPLSKDAFGASDPDRLESDARAVPIVEESSHKRKGYKETREHQLKSWR